MSPLHDPSAALPVVDSPASPSPLIAEGSAGVIEVSLEGGPEDLPVELRTHRIPCAQGEVKVPYYGGYEHFERLSAAEADGDGPVVYSWTRRTRVAE